MEGMRERTTAGSSYIECDVIYLRPHQGGEEQFLLQTVCHFQHFHSAHWSLTFLFKLSVYSHSHSLARYDTLTQATRYACSLTTHRSLLKHTLRSNTQSLTVFFSQWEMKCHILKVTYDACAAAEVHK